MSKHEAKIEIGKNGCGVTVYGYKVITPAGHLIVVDEGHALKPGFRYASVPSATAPVAGGLVAVEPPIVDPTDA